MSNDVNISQHAADWLEANLREGPATIYPQNIEGLDTEWLEMQTRNFVKYWPEQLTDGNLNAIFDGYESLGYAEHFGPTLDTIITSQIARATKKRNDREQMFAGLRERGVQRIQREIDSLIDEHAETGPVETGRIVDVDMLDAMEGMDSETELEFKKAVPLERARREARRFLDAQERAQEDEGKAIQSIGIDDLLSLDFPEEPWVIERLISEGTLTLAYSVGKAGKSYFAHQLMESMAAGTPFLGEFSAYAPSGNIGLVDLELPTRKLQSRLRAYDWADKLKLYPLRGQLPGAESRRKFDLSDEYNRVQWVERWKSDEIEYLVVDPLSAVIRDAGMSEWNEAGLALRHLQNMMDEAGIRAMVVVTHSSVKAGDEATGPRGDSAQIDVPDNVWKLTNNREANTLTLNASQTREDPVGVVMNWTADKHFTLGGLFDPFDPEKAATPSAHYAGVGTRVASRMYTEARAYAKEHNLTVDFESISSKSEADKDMWPNKTTVIQWLAEEGSMSTNEAKEKAFKWLTDGATEYFRAVGKSNNTRVIPVIRESVLGGSSSVN